MNFGSEKDLKNGKSSKIKAHLDARKNLQQSVTEALDFAKNHLNDQYVVNFGVRFVNFECLPGPKNLYGKFLLS